MNELQMTNMVCKNYEIKVGDKVMMADLVLLNIYGFDVIIRMDWLAAVSA